MSTTGPNELDEDAQPNRWLFAVFLSVLLHAVILFEVLITVWPETPGSAFRPAPLIPAMAEKMRPAPATAEQAAIPAPAPEQPVLASADTATTPPYTPVTAPLPAAALEPATAAPHRKQAALRPAPAMEPTRRHLPPPQPAAERTRYSRATARREDAAPTYASVGDWFRAMSRMRQGDFAPNRGH